jgi:hypothetical protein
MAKGDLTFVLDEEDYQRAMAALNQLDKVEQGKVIQHALSDGMKPMIAQGKSNLSVRNLRRTGNLMGSFGLRVNKKKAFAVAGHRRPKGAAAHLVDRGTAERYTKKGYYRGSVSKGNPNHGSGYWTDAVNQEGPRALEGLMDAIYTEISNIMDKA